MLFIPEDFEKAQLSLQDIEVWLEKMFQSKEETYELHWQAEQQYRIAQREREKAQAIEKAQIENERKQELVKVKRWAKNYGSEQLQLGLKLGYDCDELYVRERANVEFPGFIVDFLRDTEVYGQVNPSLEALRLVSDLKKRRKKASVIFLTSHPQDDVEDFEQGSRLGSTR